MDFANSASPSSAAQDVVVPREGLESTSVDVAVETVCWGCGLRVLVSPSAPLFRCGWCGALTRQNVRHNDNKDFRWKRLRDRCFASIVFLFMLFFICSGIWAVYPVVFSISFLCGVFHLSVTVLLSISTLSLFLLVATGPAGSPPTILWGSYPTVGKGALHDYSFCYYCSKPKSPRAHHCRSCGTCIMDMDHHCPFIGNCVGSANHRRFIFFLISTISSAIYAATMTSYAAISIWPPLKRRPVNLLLNGFVNNETEFVFNLVTENILSFLRSAVFLHARGLVLVYLFIASISVGIGLIVLIWNQLSYIYAGKTYLGHLSAANTNKTAEKDCQNIVRFFGFPYGAAICMTSYWKSKKTHEKKIHEK